MVILDLVKWLITERKGSSADCSDDGIQLFLSPFNRTPKRGQCGGGKTYLIKSNGASINKYSNICNASPPKMLF